MSKTDFATLSSSLFWAVDGRAQSWTPTGRRVFGKRRNPVKVIEGGIEAHIVIGLNVGDVPTWKPEHIRDFYKKWAAQGRRRRSRRARERDKARSEREDDSFGVFHPVVDRPDEPRREQCPQR